MIRSSFVWMLAICVVMVLYNTANNVINDRGFQIMSRVVLIRANIDDSLLAQLKQISADLTIERVSARSDEQISDDLWKRVEVLYGFPWMLPKPEQVPNLKWVQLYSAGADRLLTNPLFKTQVMFTTASGVHAIVIAEYVFTMIQTWYRNLPQMLAWQREHHWPSRQEEQSLHNEELFGKTIGIVGYGSIGRHAARIASGYGMRVLAMQHSTNHRDSGFVFPNVGDPEGTLPERYYTFDQLHEMLHECDIVVIGVPLTNETRRMFDESAFQAMKNSAFLVNIARGEVCDEAALIRALQTKQIAGAALDVFEQEPLPAESPLWDMPNVFITPHISGINPQYNERAAAIFETNLRRYLKGEPLLNLVEKERGY
ncbi:MAG TPA: D-2-hydroxyacid dehydrogenase [Ktedonobacter sp.]|nr:D-2-hydroxyacid dehydrogenase [Ktedonobacter sp.]